MGHSKPNEPLTLKKVQDCVAIEGRMGDSLKGVCFCWYQIHLEKGHTPEEAAEHALNLLGEKLLSYSKKRTK